MPPPTDPPVPNHPSPTSRARSPRGAEAGARAPVPQEDPYNIKALEFPPALRFPSLTRLGLMLTEEDPDFLAGVAGMTHLTELALVVGGAEECWESDSAGSQVTRLLSV